MSRYRKNRKNYFFKVADGTIMLPLSMTPKASLPRAQLT